jgi:hypothetical protein
MADNLAWLASISPSGLKPHFVGPLDALAMLGAD